MYKLIMDTGWAAASTDHKFIDILDIGVNYCVFTWIYSGRPNIYIPGTDEFDNLMAQLNNRFIKADRELTDR